ncbi:coiled-coil domain-containing protein 97-like [Asterias rubens]|uniref:coiled-coil domain-containing protein 97-like n=1 Tax=Asterias rubens TaxID=7604 RepID=UPI001455487F|nr:coiled-coil domain-containing protein 97-like [Asterias rubens]
MASISNENDNQEEGFEGDSSASCEVHPSEDVDHSPDARQRMLVHIAASKARIKNQQRGEEDLSPKEKLSILSELLDHKPAIFLERFHSFLREEDLDCFDQLFGEYEIDFYLKEARRRLSTRKSRMGVRNRRYEALKQLEKAGAYFSDKAMKDRDPFMFEEYIGQYMTAEELKGLQTPVSQSDLKFSSILMTFMDEQETKELYKRQKEVEDDMLEEEEEEDEDEEESDEDADTAVPSTSHEQKNRPKVTERVPTSATDEDRAMMRQEFLHHMHLRFLSGQEKDFDYSTVDGNAEYDSLVLRTQDEEEQYFDKDEEKWSFNEEECGRDGNDGPGGCLEEFDEKEGIMGRMGKVRSCTADDGNKSCGRGGLGKNTCDSFENEDMESC